jgi:hypothetical protein
MEKDDSCRRIRMNVKKAVEQVNQEYYMLQENGKMLTQTTRPKQLKMAYSCLMYKKVSEY